MTPQDFIINSLNGLVMEFPYVRARYENHLLSNAHFVEVVPNEVYRLNEEYQKWEEKVTFQFIEKFPSENLCFISDDAIVGIGNIDYEAKGELFELDLYYSGGNFNTAIEVKTIEATEESLQLYYLLFGENQHNILSEVNKISCNIVKRKLPLVKFSAFPFVSTDKEEKEETLAIAA